MSETVEIFTDGACSGNPGRGGWGAILRYGGKEKELSGGETNTTNNRMELTAVIKSLETLKRPCTVDLYTDSQYVKNGVMEWMRGWRARGLENRRPQAGEERRSVGADVGAGAAPHAHTALGQRPCRASGERARG